MTIPFKSVYNLYGSQLKYQSNDFIIVFPTYARIYKEISSFYPKKTPELDEFSYYLYAHDLLRDTMDLTSFNFLIDSDIDELSLKWYDEGNITNSLINDDVDRIIEYSTTNDISKRFIRYKNNNFSLLGLSAFASAVKIFKYLLLNMNKFSSYFSHFIFEDQNLLLPFFILQKNKFLRFLTYE